MTAETLALKYRPRSFADVVGQTVTAVTLSRMVSEDKVPQGFLFAGPRGSGKTSMARILAGALDAEVIEVDAASHGLVDDVRQMIDTLRFSGKRVIIYDEAHSMSPEAFNALLKVLEEPPAGTTFILVTTEPHRIKDTVKSRLMEFTFHKLTTRDIGLRLEKIQSIEGILADIELLHHIASKADGSMRDAVMMLDQCWRGGITELPEFLELSGEPDVGPDLVLALLSGDHAHLFSAVDDLNQRVPDPAKLASMLVQTLRDVLVLQAGGKLSVSDSGLEKRKTIAHFVITERVVAAMKLLWDLRTRVRASNDPRGSLDLALTLIMDIFTGGKAIVPPKPVFNKVETPEKVNVAVEAEPTPEQRRLTFAEL